MWKKSKTSWTNVYPVLELSEPRWGEGGVSQVSDTREGQNWAYLKKKGIIESGHGTERGTDSVKVKHHFWALSSTVGWRVE